MYNYGIGGQEVPKDAAEAIADIPQNRTLMIEKLTADAPVKPEITEGLTTVEDVFRHFKPRVSCNFQKEDGSCVAEDLSFTNLGDFGVKGITSQSNYLKELQLQKDEFLKLVRQLKTNKLMKTMVDTGESKEAFVGALRSLIQEIDDAG